jgi:hypothetical protein
VEAAKSLPCSTRWPPRLGFAMMSLLLQGQHDRRIVRQWWDNGLVSRGKTLYAWVEKNPRGHRRHAHALSSTACRAGCRWESGARGGITESHVLSDSWLTHDEGIPRVSARCSALLVPRDCRTEYTARFSPFDKGEMKSGCHNPSYPPLARRGTEEARPQRGSVGSGPPAGTSISNALALKASSA